jgi:hypothetical protein
LFDEVGWQGTIRGLGHGGTLCWFGDLKDTPDLLRFGKP